MGMREALYIAKSIDKPIVDIDPSQRGLNSFHDEDEIYCLVSALKPQGFRVVNQIPTHKLDRPSVVWKVVTVYI